MPFFCFAGRDDNFYSKKLTGVISDYFHADKAAIPVQLPIYVASISQRQRICGESGVFAFLMRPLALILIR
jgi:hypothetical protein